MPLPRTAFHTDVKKAVATQPAAPAARADQRTKPAAEPVPGVPASTAPTPPPSPAPPQIAAAVPTGKPAPAGKPASTPAPTASAQAVSPPAAPAPAPAPAPVYTARVEFSVSGRVVDELSATLAPGAAVEVSAQRASAADCKPKPGRKAGAASCTPNAGQSLAASFKLADSADPKLAATISRSALSVTKAEIMAQSGIPGIAILPDHASIIVTLEPPGITTDQAKPAS
ncbi:MAG TPA: hypothetical protein VL574_11710 [Stellaceae bacterium]|nr:hypothetical protein [Stellaceae bacterium]